MLKNYSIYLLIIISLILHLSAEAGHAERRTFAPVVKCEPLRYFPHDLNAFTQGFLYHNGFFYESTGKHGRSAVRITDPDSGEILAESKLERSYFGEGLCLWKSRLYQLTWREGKCFVYDSRSLARKGVFKYKGQGWGLTTDGDFLYQSDGSSIITFRDPQDFQAISKLQVMDGPEKVYRLNEMEYIDGLLYCNIWQEDLIAVIDTQDGMVRFWIDISGLRPLAGPEAEAANGIAWDRKNERLFVTGKFWDKIFQIELPDITRKIAFKHLYE
ncbi:glutaminyl-peptide cyclotransferase [Maridesulfovibrio sp. FT414]|uniref:glutaminyl-peptide cyclotransferase n=1 Tax=Maridesulfovibrio sp. FT414 TaxID=2979469 RepID=UPI003D808260